MTPRFAIPSMHPQALARRALALGVAAGLFCAVAARADAAVRVVHLVADSASGTGPYPSPSAGPPWMDLAGAHNGNLSNFFATPVSGWMGDGSLASPHRLEYTGTEDRVVIAAGSVPELQSATQPVTAEVWFRTGMDGPLPRQDYVLEWLQTAGEGMGIAVENGQLKVSLGPWVSVGAVNANRWYHVVVAKQPGSVRVHVNGQLRYTGTQPHMGAQVTPIGIGASVWRHLGGQQLFGEVLHGAVAEVTIWQGALTDPEAEAAFRADSARYLPEPNAPPQKILDLRADTANGSGPYAVPGATSPWVDLAGGSPNFTLRNFSGTSTSGWAGLGVPGEPYRLEFDGANDVSSPQ